MKPPTGGSNWISSRLNQAEYCRISAWSALPILDCTKEELNIVVVLILLRTHNLTEIETLKGSNKMRIKRGKAALIALAPLLLTISLTFQLAYPTTTTAASIAAQKSKKSHKHESKDDSANAKNVLWEEPTDIQTRDLYYGPGGKEGSPESATRVTFVKRSTSGTSEKIHVVDDQNRKWIVKFGAEARPETAATRIVWAVGYHVDEDYFVKNVQITGPRTFNAYNVRFKRSDDGFKKDELWSWDNNPFKGSKELEGLKVLMALIGNWDLKTSNNKIAVPSKKSGGDRDERIYYVADLGGSLGKTGTIFSKLHVPTAPAGSKGIPGDYESDQFVKGVKDGKVIFNYKGKDPGTLKDVTVEDARWIGDLLGRLSDKQMSDAFRCAGYDDNDVNIYVQTVKKRIQELQSLR